MSEMLRGFARGKVAGEQALLSSYFFPYKSSLYFQELNCCHILYSNATYLTLGSSTYFSLLFPFLVFTVSGITFKGG